MATETVPADIAAAIDRLTDEAKYEGGCFDTGDERRLNVARAALNDAILTHLRKADELKATLERITSGGA